MRLNPLMIAGAAVVALLTPAAIAKPRTAVRVETGAGVIVIALHSKEAPASSRAFRAQVEGKRYDGGSFFRAVRPDNDRSEHPIEVVQAGVRQDGIPVAEPKIAHEDTSRTGLKHIDGAVSLPRAAIGTSSATSFFISIGAQPALDFGGKRNPDGHGFAVFGQVICGMEVVRKIQAQPVSASGPPSPMQGQILDRPVRIIRARLARPRCGSR